MKTNIINSALASIMLLLMTGCASKPSATTSVGEYSATVSQNKSGSSYNGVPARNLPDSR